MENIQLFIIFICGGICGLIGGICGLIIGWFIPRTKLQLEFQKKIDDVEKRNAILEDSILKLEKSLIEKEEAYKKENELFQQERLNIVKTETQLAEANKRLEEQKKLLDEATQRLKDTFNSLASEALMSNNQSFMTIASNIFEKFISEAKGDLEKRQEAISQILKPLKESIEKHEGYIREVENSRQSAYTSIKQYLEDLRITQEKLQKETNTLVTALKTSQVRGKYGEIGLRRIVEFAGMTEYCDFEEQVSINTEEGKLRPDLIIKLPGNRTVIVDSKVPLLSYMEAFETTNEDERKALLLKHSQAVRNHLKNLSTKAYWNQFKNTPDFVVLYMQIESSFGAALEYDKTLIEDGINNRIIFATPTTLITLLKTVAYSWHQEKVTENARKIWESGVELYNRVAVLLGHINKIGSNLKSAVINYNEAVGSIERRFIPQVKRLKEEISTITVQELPELKEVDTVVRSLPEGELTEEQN